MQTNILPTEIVGHTNIVMSLLSALERRNIAPAYIFAGPEGVGKRTLAASLLQSLLCIGEDNGVFCGQCVSCTAITRSTHPDSITVSQEGSLGIDAVRDLIHALARKPSLSQSHGVCIESAERFTEEAANALLKTLEEPRSTATVILVTSNLSAMPLTVRSRCQIIEFGLVDTSAIESWVAKRAGDAEQARLIAHLALGRPGMAHSLSEDPEALQEHIDAIAQVTHCIESPLPERFKTLQSLMPAKGAAGLEQRSVAKRIVSAFQTVFRDVTLYQHDCQEYIANRFLLDRLPSIAKRYSPREVVQHIRRLDTLQHDLRRNVQPMLALEQFATTL